jgi:hypothetical protein
VEDSVTMVNFHTTQSVCITFAGEKLDVREGFNRLPAAVVEQWKQTPHFKALVADRKLKIGLSDDEMPQQRGIDESKVLDRQKELYDDRKIGPSDLVDVRAVSNKAEPTGEFQLIDKLGEIVETHPSERAAMRAATEHNDAAWSRWLESRQPKAKKA